MNNGFLFLMIATGVMASICFISLCVAVSDRKDDRAEVLGWVLAILVVAFLVSGFQGFN